jgi:hypothetical protein
VSVTLEDLAARVARLEEHQGLATRTDLVDIRRDIASLATGIGTDLRSLRSDLAAIHTDLSDIRRLLERRTFRWPWEA